MRRRELIGGVAAAAIAWPLKAWAQQSTLPVIGMLNGQSAEGYSHLADAVRLGLKDEGFVDGQNVTIEYRWAAGRDEQLPAMAVELVNRPVAVLLTRRSPWSAISAKAATATIHIVFTTTSGPSNLAMLQASTDPAAMSLASASLGANLSRSGWNWRATGAQGGRYRISRAATRTDVCDRQKSYRECRRHARTKVIVSRY